MTSSDKAIVELVYDSSKPAPYQFYNTSTSNFISAQEAETLTNRGECRLVIGAAPSTISVVDIIYDELSVYWECYYNTDTDSFLCAQDANTLVDVGLARIVPGKIPYVITEDENGCFYDVVRNDEISGEEAESLFNSGRAVLKRKKASLVTGDYKTLPLDDKSSTALSDGDQGTGKYVSEDHVTEPPPDYNTATTPQPTLLQIATDPICAEKSRASDTIIKCKKAVSYDPSSNLPQPRCNTSSLGSSNRGETPAKQRHASSSSSNTLKDIVVPIAAGVGIAAVGLATVATAVFLGGGGKKKKRK